MSAIEAGYTGDEDSVELTADPRTEATDTFEFRHSFLPENSVPVYDHDLGAIVGYRTTGTSVVKFFDLEGNIVGLDDPGIESPLIDPIDLLFFGSGAVRGLTRSAMEVGTEVAATSALRLAAGRLSAAIVGAMRTGFKGLAVRSLKFTATTAVRMATEGRYVPMHILHLALKYGKRVPDPQGAAGAFMYTLKMFRAGKEYTLELVVREVDWTILHFVYRK